jgi:hypothetical protein
LRAPDLQLLSRMEYERARKHGPIPITEAIRDAQEGFRHLLRSEFHLASTEMKTGFLALTRRSRLLAIFAGLALWGILPFTAFLVIGLGELLGGRYWLSALILAIVSLGLGTAMCVQQFRKLKDEDLSLRRTRRTIGRKLRRVA